MSRTRVSCFSLSVDGFGAGPGQTLENPHGIGGTVLHEWAFATRAFRERVLGENGGETGIDNDFMERSLTGFGAWILGRNMFGPVRGDWSDDGWRGWWGDNPPFHTDTFVLTNHARAPIVMQGGTTFHFVTDGIHAALERAKAAAKGRDVRIGGGVETIRQYLEAGLVDEMHLAVSPALLGRGENLLAGIDLPACGLSRVERTSSPAVTHYVLSRAQA